MKSPPASASTARRSRRIDACRRHRRGPRKRRDPAGTYPAGSRAVQGATHSGGRETGSPGRTRTSDPAVNSRLLYQLSYRGSSIALWPLTSRLNVQLRALYSIKPATIPDTAALAAPAAGPVAPRSESWQISAACGRIAQLVEQLTLNQRVLGSSPSAPTNLFNGLDEAQSSREKREAPMIHRTTPDRGHQRRSR